MLKHAPAGELSAATGFAFNPIDRMSERRDEPGLFDRFFDDPNSRFVVIGRDRPVLKIADGQLDPLHTRAEALAIGQARETVLLGKDDERAIFALMIDDSAIAVEETVSPSGLAASAGAWPSATTMSAVWAVAAVGEAATASESAVGALPALAVVQR